MKLETGMDVAPPPSGSISDGLTKLLDVNFNTFFVHFFRVFTDQTLTGEIPEWKEYGVTWSQRWSCTVAVLLIELCVF